MELLPSCRKIGFSYTTSHRYFIPKILHSGTEDTFFRIYFIIMLKIPGLKRHYSKGNFRDLKQNVKRCTCPL